MRKIITILLFTGCTKYEVIQTSSSEQIDAKTISLKADTTVNGIWDLGGKVLRINDKVIHGTGTVQNFILDAALTQPIFDTSLNLKNIKTYGEYFSSLWLGVKSSNADNWWNIQKSINICKENRLKCITLGTGFKYSKTLDFSTMVNGRYVQSYNYFVGDASYWDNGRGTTFLYTGLTGPAVNLQLQKGSKVKNVAFKGMYKCPGGVDSIFFRRTEAEFTDQSGYNLPDSYTGIAFDYYYDGYSRSGSTGIEMTDVSVDGFAIGIGFSQNGMTVNNEAHVLDKIHLFDLKYGIVICNAQEKGTSINHIYSWGSIYNVVNIGFFGAKQAGNYSFDGANIAYRCIEPVKAQIGQWFSSSFSNWFCESIDRVCTISAGMPFTFQDCNFDLKFSYSKQRNVIISNSNFVSFTGCTIRYYDGIGGDIWVNNAATFNNCSFYFGKVVYK